MLIKLIWLFLFPGHRAKRNNHATIQKEGGQNFEKNFLYFFLRILPYISSYTLNQYSGSTVGDSFLTDNILCLKVCYKHNWKKFPTLTPTDFLVFQGLGTDWAYNECGEEIIFISQMELLWYKEIRACRLVHSSRVSVQSKILCPQVRLLTHIKLHFKFQMAGILW